MPKGIIDVDGLNDVLENTPIDALETEEVNLMFLAIDSSGSMDQYTSVMKSELEKFKQAITNSKESDKILVSRADFSDDLNFRGYKLITEFDIDYAAEGNTRLYDVIMEGSQRLKAYMNSLKQQGMRVKAIFAIFSDGQDTASRHPIYETSRVIDELNQIEVVTVFVSFGSEALNVARDDLKIRNILKVGQTESELRKAFNQLSKSLINQSKSVLPKKDDFFEM